MDNDFYRPQGTDSQSSDTNQTTMGQEPEVRTLRARHRTVPIIMEETLTVKQPIIQMQHMTVLIRTIPIHSRQMNMHGSREPVLHLQKKTIPEARRKRQRK